MLPLTPRCRPSVRSRPAQAGAAPESLVLEEEIDENYEPTHDEIVEYAKWMGMDPEAEAELLWIAREGLKAPLPENWKPCRSPDGEIYYFNFTSGESVWEHPCDEYYRKVCGRRTECGTYLYQGPAKSSILGLQTRVLARCYACGSPSLSNLSLSLYV